MALVHSQKSLQISQQKCTYKHRLFALILVMTMVPSKLNAAKTNQAVYEDPFDLAAGGASLTRASQAGVLFANPALMPFGKFHHWVGLQTGILVNKESVDTAKQMIQSAQGKSSDASATSSANSDFVDKVFKDPVHVGTTNALSYINKFFGLGIISKFEADIRARKYGDAGLPQIEFQAESYQGAGASMAIRTPLRWLSFGGTGKYLLAAEPDIAVEITDEEKIKEFRSPSYLQSITSHNSGVGLDAGALIFAQGSWIDFKLALKVDDVGNTKFVGDNSPKQFKQVMSAGTGLTLHTGSDAIHFAMDYRDIQNSYAEPMFKKFYAGTKLVLRSYVGLAMGIYQGYPSMGAEVDLIFFRVSGTYVTRELGDHPGADPRQLYMISIAAGF